MGAADEFERRIVVAEGILDPDEARALAAEAARGGQGLLERLRGIGRISEPTFASLRLRVAEQGQPTERRAAAGTTPPRDAALAATVHGGPPRSPASAHDPRHAPDHHRADDDPDAFPAPGWDRYEPIRLLGKGGMGLVFLARDLRLHRNVAIKFVRGDDPELTRRIVAEARAQAKVNDDRVCKVFDVGEIRGRVYIAMQAIEGRTLSELRGELGYEQQALVMRGAALGVHEAHKVGLVHRDLKPSNIMVERTADGELRPFVMDFGVARDWTDSATMTGTVLGTPHYMAPEQARGEIKQLDRRADVYSLGATLYALLVDRPPITGDNPLVVLNRISLDEPPRPRTLDPDVPADLEAIVMKCLEKERAARYDSARALADDLGRFLGGEAVVARAAAGLSYRLRKFVRRRWRLVLVAAVVLAIVGVALGFGLRERWQAARRETVARRFTEQVERIESLAIRSALSPAHDIRSDREKIEAEMDAIARAMRAEGSVARAAGHYALGRGHLALGDDERAERELETARQRGFRDPRAAFALALAKGHLFERGLRDVELMNPAAAAARRRLLQDRYRAPALDLLRDLDAPGVPSAYVTALIGFYEERFDDALADLATIDRSAGGMSSFYQAPLLRGQILHARALAHKDRGEPVQAAADLELSRTALVDAAAIADSDPATHVALAHLEQTTLNIEVFGAGAVGPPFERGLAAIERALAILPDQAASLELRARLRHQLAVHRADRGEDVTALFDLAIADAERASALAPDRREARFELAELYGRLGQLRQGQGEDPRAELREAVTVVQGVAVGERDAAAHLNLALALSSWADYEDASGADSTAQRQQAIDASELAVQLEPTLAAAHHQLGLDYYTRASEARSADPDADLDRARTAFEAFHTLRPAVYVPLYYLGAVHELMAERRRARGGDPGPDLALALEAYRRGLAVSPGAVHLHNGISMVHVQQATDAWDRGEDPDPLLADAFVAASEAVAAGPAQADGYNNRGEALARRAAYQAERGADPRNLARAAAAEYAEALGRAENPTFLLNLAGTDVLVADHLVDQGGDPRPVLTQARRRIDAAMASNPTEPDAHRRLGEVSAILARWQARRGQPADAAFEQAARSFRRARELAPDDRDLQLAFGRFCLTRTRASVPGRAGDDALAEGSTTAERLLAARPGWAAARCLRAQLLVQQAMQAASADRRRQATTAATELAAAVAANPNLAPAAEQDLRLARRLAGPP